MAKNFPAELEMKVLLTNGDGYGVATIGLGHGQLPTLAEVQARIERFAKEELATLDGYRLATAPEYWDYVCTEKTGQTFACPAEWREFDASNDTAGRLLADLTDAAAQLRKYETLHLARQGELSTELADMNAALAARFEATIAAAVGGAE